jgi:hypothetical protein
VFPSLRDSNPPTTRKAIAALEHSTGLALPALYKDFLLATSGGIPDKPVFSVSGGQGNPNRAVSFFLGMGGPWPGRDLAVMLEEFRTGGVRQGVPAGIVPIACTTGPAYVCLDLRDGQGRVVLWDVPIGGGVWREEDLHHVANSFEEFLASLRPDSFVPRHLSEADGTKLFPNITEGNPPTTPEAIAEFERSRGLALPALYKQFLLAANGGRPDLRVFPIKGMAFAPYGTLHFLHGLDARLPSYDLGKIFDRFKNGIPEGMVPIACTDGTGYICLDLRGGQERVAFWDNRHFWGTGEWRESDLYQIASSFLEFLGWLRPDPD